MVVEHRNETQEVDLKEALIQAQHVLYDGRANVWSALALLAEHWDHSETTDQMNAIGRVLRRTADMLGNSANDIGEVI
ncbi:hypothetical protein [Thiomonas sp.]